MMKFKILVLLLIGVSTGLISINCSGRPSESVDCQEGINLLPMYGRVNKCKGQLDIDAEFLKESDKKEPNRAKAAIDIMDLGWYYLHQGDTDTAMKRINQAWLLDSTNIAVYASFVVILDLVNKPDEAIKMLDLTFDKLSTRINPEIPTQINPSNQMFAEFIVSNTSFTYKKVNNLTLPEYLYTKLDTLNISGVNAEVLKNDLKLNIPQIN
ncbi:hypothetical protein G7051_12750 [Dysgonomonas sp. HDW5B]|uniref:tetratricopeptide repeat protein n=1 Tax=Dysgonomonas sp. HDW5B TaxID=2714927 RepID=UPI00140B5DA9|nr:hypothetical protein [Dysgonomonas sp. HDW5B]QIK55162.1 hypothetical protein G7051_12750 [Dysgonomonas sp. HDW5B]